jgi:transcriptional regulator with XRE-family HTH domain
LVKSNTEVGPVNEAPSKKAHPAAPRATHKAQRPQTSARTRSLKSAAATTPTPGTPNPYSLIPNPSSPQSADAITSEAAESLLEAKRIGERIKHLRQRKSMGLVELGRYTGLSASFLSQLETGRVVPTLRNLARIAMVFSRDLSYFFAPDEPELFRIVRASDRQRLPQTGTDEPNYFFESLGQVPIAPGTDTAGQRIVPYIAEFLPRPTNPTTETRPIRAHQHAGSEFLYMLSGRLKLTHDGKEEIFESGDAAYFHADATHSYERLGEDPCTALILTLPEPNRTTTLPSTPNGTQHTTTTPTKKL